MGMQTVLGETFYRSLQLSWHTDLIGDQRLGGGIAWAAGEVPLVVVMIALLIQWRRSDQRTAKRLDRAADRDDDADWRHNAMLAELACRRDTPLRRRMPYTGCPPPSSRRTRLPCASQLDLATASAGSAARTAQRRGTHRCAWSSRGPARRSLRGPGVGVLSSPPAEGDIRHAPRRRGPDRRAPHASAHYQRRLPTGNHGYTSWCHAVARPPPPRRQGERTSESSVAHSQMNGRNQQCSRHPITVVGNIVTDPDRKRVGDQEVIKFRLPATRGGAPPTATGSRQLVVPHGQLLGPAGHRRRRRPLGKGDPVIVVGYVYTSEYEDREGVRRSSLEVRATSVGPDRARIVRNREAQINRRGSRLGRRRPEDRIHDDRRGRGLRRRHRSADTAMPRRRGRCSTGRPQPMRPRLGWAASNT